MQREHRMQANIAACRCSEEERRFELDDTSSFAPDFTKLAERTGNQLTMHDTLSGRLLCTWSLPPRRYECSSEWGWYGSDWTVALPFGRMAGQELPGTECNGFVMCNLCTAACAIVLLPEPWHASGGCQWCLLTVEWASKHLLVHAETPSQTMLWVYSSDGSLVHSTDTPDQRMTAVPLMWSPCEEQVFWVQHDDETLGHIAFLWRAVSGTPTVLRSSQGSPVQALGAIWSPCSDRLLALTGSDAMLFCSQGRQLAPAQELGAHCVIGSWSDSGIALVLAVSQQLRVYCMDGLALSLQRIVQDPSFDGLAHWCDASPHGDHVLLRAACNVMVVSLANGSVQAWS